MKVLLSSLLLLSFHVVAQSPDSNIDHSAEIKELREKVEELTEITNEQSEIIKRQLKDSHFDQNSRGYLEVKIGRAFLDPEDIEDLNNDVFSGLDSAEWDDFEYSNTLDIEFGKSILASSGKHEVGIGYQYLRSHELKGSYTDNGQSGKVSEKIQMHTIYGRYAYLIPIGKNQKFFFGPGVTFGFSPVSELSIEVREGDQGVKIKGEGESYLFEFFGKGKYEFARYFYFVSTLGYRIQKANNLELSAAELVSVSSKIDLDVSGFFGTVGLAYSF